MDINFDFVGNKRLAPAKKPSAPKVVNMSNSDMRRHEDIIECRQRAMKFKADLDAANAKVAQMEKDLEAAMGVISTANSEIDRLNAEVSRLQGELKTERDRKFKSKKQKNRFWETDSSNPAEYKPW